GRFWWSISPHARRRVVASAHTRNRRQENALRTPGRFSGLQVRRAPDGGTRCTRGGTQRTEERGHCAGRTAPGESPHHPRHAGASRAPRRKGHGQHRPLRQHHWRDDSAWLARRRRSTKTEKGRLGATHGGRRGIHHRKSVAPLGVLVSRAFTIHRKRVVNPFRSEERRVGKDRRYT